MEFIGISIFSIITFFMTTFGTGGNDFDFEKLALKNGISTKYYVEETIGLPYKTGIENGRPVAVYEHHEYIMGNIASKDLVVMYNDDGIVIGFQYFSTK